MYDSDFFKNTRTTREAVHLVKESVRETVRQKAKRLKDGGRVVLEVNEANIVSGDVEGDHGIYKVILERTDPSNNKLTQWDCGCDWSYYAHMPRTRNFKKFYNRLCSHAMAAMWTSWSLPLTNQPEQIGQPQQQQLFTPPTPQLPQKPNYEILPQQSPEELPTPEEVVPPEEPEQLAFPGLQRGQTPPPGLLKATKWKRI
jgi:hypothetical protein